MSYFVTGTDTGIGKTVIATLLAKGLGAFYWKPIQTGFLSNCASNCDSNCDSDFARTWIGAERVLPETYLFALPASPHLAASAAGIRIELGVLKLPIDKPVIVEGAGGVLVPLNEKDLMIDLAKSLNLPVIVVAATRLGTINHTLLTLEALKAREMKVAGIILNGPEVPELENTLSRFGKVIGRISVCQEFSHQWFESTFAKLEFT